MSRRCTVEGCTAPANHRYGDRGRYICRPHYDEARIDSPRTTMSYDELVYEVEHFRRFGYAGEFIAQRLGKPVATIQRNLQRAGRHDLARLFSYERERAS